jgi:hypothetical protein
MAILSLLIAAGFVAQGDAVPRHFCLPGPGIRFTEGAALDEQARAILDVAATTILSLHPRPHILLRGYADTLGPRAANLRLAWRRARAARDYLVAHRVPGRLLVLAAAGEGDLILRTADETAEPLNRFVGIAEIVSPAERARRAARPPATIVC